MSYSFTSSKKWIPWPQKHMLQYCYEMVQLTQIKELNSHFKTPSNSGPPYPNCFLGQHFLMFLADFVEKGVKMIRAACCLKLAGVLFSCPWNITPHIVHLYYMIKRMVSGLQQLNLVGIQYLWPTPLLGLCDSMLSFPSHLFFCS